ncbi:hypothetical protein D3C86_1719160 [compost metagenome]
MKGAPTMAPMPMSVPAWVPPASLANQAPTIAMMGMIVSGRAVPTAASTLPTAPSERLSFLPNHSMALVKASHARMIPPIESRTQNRLIKISTRPPQQKREQDSPCVQSAHNGEGLAPETVSSRR